MIKPHRTIETALVYRPNTNGQFEFVRALTSDRILKMSHDQWGFFRDQASNHRVDPKNGLLISCLECGQPLFIRSRKNKVGHLPELSHHKNSPVPCRWNTGKNLSPDQARAAQYNGRQESELHKRLCNLVFEAARSDGRFVKGTVDEYRHAQNHERGRYPDVLCEWEDFGSFVCEIQLSSSLQTEIAEREDHYAKENVKLLWLFYGANFSNAALTQSKIDVIRRHRGNAFVIDADSIYASQERKTLILSCYQRKSETEFHDPVLVSLNDLTYSEKGLPYFRDCITPRLLEPAHELRRRWIKVLNQLNPSWRRGAQLPETLRPLLEELKSRHKDLPRFADEPEEGYTIVVLLAFCFTIVAHANGRTEISYVVNSDNLAAIINTMMQHPSIGMQRYTKIIEYLLERTPLANKLPRSVRVHLDRSLNNAKETVHLKNEAEWSILSELIPEIFDETIRAQLNHLGTLPAWAKEK